MAELARWCRAQSLSETMTNAVIKAFVDLDSLRSCANDPGMVDEGLKEQNLPLALRMKVVAAVSALVAEPGAAPSPAEPAAEDAAPAPEAPAPVPPPYTLCYHDAGAWQGEKVSRRRQSLVALGAALPRRRRASPPAPTFEKDVLAETPSSAAPAAGRRRRTRPVPGSLPAVTPVPPARPRPTTAAVDGDEPPRRKKPCFGPSASLETLADVESRFPGALPPQ